MTKCPLCTSNESKRKCLVCNTTICSVCCKKIAFENSKCRICPFFQETSKLDNIDNTTHLTVTGAPKTASCSMIGMLNSHPEIFIFMQVEFQNSMVSSPYTRAFLEKYPDTRFLFRGCDNLDIKYVELIKYFRKKGHNFKYLGDKIVSVAEKRLDEFINHKVIFTIRDIRTWLMKKSIRILYLTGLDVIPAAIDYSIYFIKSFNLPNILHSRMEDFIGNNPKTIENVGRFLGMPLSPHTDKWWEKVIIKDENNPKHTMPWWENHPRSATEPVAQDTIVKLRPHEFWDELLPIFDKYYQQIDKKFSHNEIQKDINKIKTLIKYSPLQPNQLYSALQEDANCSL